MTHDAIVALPVRYAMTVVGAIMPGGLFSEMVTNFLDAAAGRIGGLGRSTRIESLHFLAGSRTFGNPFVAHFAEFLDSCLRPMSPPAQREIIEELWLFLRN